MRWYLSHRQHHLEGRFPPSYLSLWQGFGCKLFHVCVQMCGVVCRTRESKRLYGSATWRHALRGFLSSSSVDLRRAFFLISKKRSCSSLSVLVLLLRHTHKGFSFSRFLLSGFSLWFWFFFRGGFILLYWRHVLLLVYTPFSHLNFNWRCTTFPLSASVHVEVFAPICKCKRVSGTSPRGSVCFHLLRLPCSEYVCFLDNLVPDAAITMGMVLLNEAATSKGDVGKRRSKSAKLFLFPFFCYCCLLCVSLSFRPARFEHLYEALWISKQWLC